MLLRFEVANHRSILGPAELSMIAVDRDRAAVRTFKQLNQQVLTVAGIYGPNASGKSNVVDALLWLASAVRLSLRAWEDIIPREPFKFTDGPDQPSSFEIEFMVDQVRTRYELELTDTEVTHEAVVSYPEGRPRTLFERSGTDITFRRGLGGLTGTRELLTPTTLALSAARRFGEPTIGGLYQAIAGMTPIGTRTGRRRYLADLSSRSSVMTATRLFSEEIESLRGQKPTSVSTGVESHEAVRSAALAMLRVADLGIDDVKVTYESQGPNGSRRPRIQLVHAANDQQIPFELEEESDGTRSWLNLIGPALVALGREDVVIFDEIDASLHPRLSAQLLELFKDPATNPNGAQLIFTSHDTSLLNHLNRDEVWLTEKGPDAATKLTALAEFSGERVRKSTNLERAYLQGRFGALPDVDQAVVRQAVLGQAQ